MADAEFVNMFTFDGQGWPPCPVVVDASGASAEEMQEVARRLGHEAGFVLPAGSDDHDFTFRFFVPNHEMEMCGHATIGAPSQAPWIDGAHRDPERTANRQPGRRGGQRPGRGDHAAHHRQCRPTD